MVGVENYKNVLETLLIVKQKYKINPRLIAGDFSPNIIGPICEVFGEDKLQIDGFHVMQELNRGIRTDILLYKKQLFVKEIQELKSLRKLVTQLQNIVNEPFKVEPTINKEIKEIEPKHQYSYKAFKIIESFIELVKEENAPTFEINLKERLNSLKKNPGQSEITFITSIEKCFPKRELTNKGMKRLKLTILNKLKKFFLSYRQELEEKNKKFYKNYWLLFFQPEKMTDKRKDRLNEFLLEYPELQEYRSITLSIGEIYRQSVHLVDGHQIDDLEIKSYYSERLQTAIKTIKKFKDSIIRFSTVFKNNPRLAKICRPSMEYFNKKFKLPFKKSFSRCNQITIEAKLRAQLSCEIQFSLD